MNTQTRRLAAALVCALLVGALASSAWASFIIQITMSDNFGRTTGLINVDVPVTGGGYQATGDTVERWALSAPIYGYAEDNTLLGTINSLSVEFDADPYVKLAFQAEAGAADTTFNISAGGQTISMTNPLAYATAGVTLTDVDDGTGAAITGLYGGKVWRATYNGSTVFADLVSGFSIGTEDITGTASERVPSPSGRQTIPGAVNNIDIAYNFTLSAYDMASGTGTFNLTPEPATLALLVLGGGVVLVARRRRVR
jgi:predicted secreted protein